MKRRNNSDKLRRENERLKKENDELRRQLDETRKEKKQIEKEYNEYKARHPETVGVKNGKPYVIKESTKSSKAKKPGAQKGHKPFFRKMPDHIEKTVEIPVTTCPCCCGVNLSKGVQEVRERVVEDIPVCKPVNTRYLIERRYCRDCKKTVEMPVTQALPKARLGLRTMLMVVYLKVGLRMPVKSIQDLLQQVFELSISEGGICKILEQVAAAFGPYYDQLLQELRNASARHMDETSWRINGENAWLWVFITKGLAIYRIASKRSHEVPLEVLGKKPKGVDIHDRFSAYKALARKTGKRPQQFCWAHIISDSKELAKFYGEDGEHIHNVLKGIYARAKDFDHKGTDEDIEKLYMDMAQQLDRPYKSHRCYRFVENLLKDGDSLFQFVICPDVEGTNNIAERAIRHSVVARKISGGSRSSKGAKIYETLISVLHTLKIRNQHLLDYGPQIIHASNG